MKQTKIIDKSDFRFLRPKVFERILATSKADNIVLDYSATHWFPSIHIFRIDHQANLKKSVWYSDIHPVFYHNILRLYYQQVAKYGKPKPTFILLIIDYGQILMMIIYLINIKTYL